LSKHKTFCNECGKTFCKMHGHLLMKCNECLKN
jgi:hypothetical protein